MTAPYAFAKTEVEAVRIGRRFDTSTAPSAAQLATEDAAWDGVAARHAAALDDLFASLTARAARGEDRPLNIDDLND